ncbi:MAG: NAD(P)-dependent glycerol-3-phosphate dehydrogenase [Phycisphaerales bacterium]|nr:NAD(P)-dependent glycerol-3-phosphate dehydrogenase [Phycisphaerales bacterium]
MDDTRVTLIGTGQMGLVLATILTGKEKPPAVRLWGRDRSTVEALIQTRESTRHLPGLLIPESVQLVADDEQALRDADLIISCVPTQHLREVWDRLKTVTPPLIPIATVSKGIENGTLLRPTQVIADALQGKSGPDQPDGPARPLATLTGPTVANELARCLPATIIAASDTPEFASRLQTLLTTSWFRVYTNSDLLGAELAGATKNVIAIAAGVIDGLQAGDNAKSALLSRGLAEITRLGVAMGGRMETFFGIAGVGDLATTCFSPHGRNRTCGEALGKGVTLEQYLEETHSVVEGVPTTKSVMELARRYNVEMPITEAVHAVLYEGLDPIDGITRLMTRQPKPERIG